MSEQRVRAEPAHRPWPLSDEALFAEFAAWYDVLDSIALPQPHRRRATKEPQCR